MALPDPLGQTQCRLRLPLDVDALGVELACFAALAALRSFALIEPSNECLDRAFHLGDAELAMELTMLHPGIPKTQDNL